MVVVTVFGLLVNRSLNDRDFLSSSRVMTSSMNDEQQHQWYHVESSYLLNELARLGYHRYHDRQTTAATHYDSSSSRPTSAAASSSSVIHGSNPNTNNDTTQRIEQQKRALREQWRVIHEDRILTRLHRAHTLQSSSSSAPTNDDGIIDDVFGVGSTTVGDDTGTIRLFNESLQSLRLDNPPLHVTRRHQQFHTIVNDSRTHRRDPFTAIISMLLQALSWLVSHRAHALVIMSYRIG
jgi:hypothetical protein